jgi:hypothetical protein
MIDAVKKASETGAFELQCDYESQDVHGEAER